MTLHTERLTIRNIMQEDWEYLRDIWMDFRKSPYVQYDRPVSTEDGEVKARIAQWAGTAGEREHMFFAICLARRVIGFASFHLRDNGYEMGYCFHSDFQGRGYARESLSALLSYLKTLGINNFSAGTALANIPSVRLLTALGFRMTGQEKVSFYRDAKGNDIVFDGGIFELSL